MEIGEEEKEKGRKGKYCLLSACHLFNNLSINPQNTPREEGMLVLHSQIRKNGKL